MSHHKPPKVVDRRFIPSGQLVIEQGCIGNRAFLIEKGKVEVFMRDRTGYTVKIAEVGAGSIIGEMALLDGGIRSASIRTLEDSTLIAISQQDIDESAGQPGGLLQKMMKLMVERLKDTNNLLIQHSSLQTGTELNRLCLPLSPDIPETNEGNFQQSMLPLLARMREKVEKYRAI